MNFIGKNNLDVIFNTRLLSTLRNNIRSIIFSNEVKYSTHAVNNMGNKIDENTFKTQKNGELGTKNYNINFLKNNNNISPWHDIPLEGSEPGTYNMIVEIPKYSLAKMEIDTKKEHNPIRQDIKNDKVRFYHGPIFWNYGAVPQTWEDPNTLHPDLKISGDNDPLDVVEIGSKTFNMGDIIEVKPLGILSMIDDEELDWKLIAINKKDPIADKLQIVSDIDKFLPGTISGIREWFRWYKTPDGKPINKFGHNEECLDSNIAIEIIRETNESWKNLINRKIKVDKLWLPE